MKWILFALAACGLLSACSGKDDAPKTDETVSKSLYVYNWSDYIAEDTVATFEKETGIKVVYDVYDGNETLEAKLLAGASGYDVVFPSARPFAEKHIATGIYANLDKALLPNERNNDSAVMAALAGIDPGNAKLMPYLWGTTGIGINVKKVREILGKDAVLDSWSLIFDPDVAGKLAQCGIAVLDDPEDAFTSAALWKGLDPRVSDAKTLSAIKAAFLGTRPNITYFHSSKYIADLANGDICVAMSYSGDVFQARDCAAEAGNGMEIAFVIPKEGAARWIDVMAVPADAPNKTNAMKFIDFLMKAEIAAGIAEYVSYATPNTAAKALLPAESQADESIYPPPEVTAKLVDPITFPVAVQRDRVRLWTTIKTGK